MSREPIVFVVDDDASLRTAVAGLLEAEQIPVETFASAQEFLDTYDPDTPGCLVLDVQMPGVTGLQLQDILRERSIDIPVVMVTGHGDVPMAVQAVQHGAIEFLEKPVRAQTLIDVVRRGLESDQEARAARAADTSRLALLHRLTPREREVMVMLVDGHAVKQIAHELGRSPKTVQVHRTHIFEKLKAESVVDLIPYVRLHNQDEGEESADASSPNETTETPQDAL